MQEQTPVYKKKSKAKKPKARAYKQTGNNPYVQVPVKSNNPSYGFPGSIPR